MRTVRWLMVLHGLCNLIGVVDGVAYGWLAIVPTVGPADQRVLLTWSLATFAIAYLGGTAVLAWLMRPVGRALDLVAAGGQPSAADRELARRRTLNLPVIQARLASNLWWLAGASVFVLVPHLQAADPLLVAMHLLFVLITVGAVSSTMVYYLSEAWLRRTAVPALMPSGRLSAVAGVTPVPVSFKITILLAVSSLLPVSVLTFAAMAGTAGASTVLYVGLTFGGVGIVQTVAICMSITRPLSALAVQMGRIQRGDLEAQASVVSTDDIGHLAEGFNDMVAGLRRAQFVKETFGRYVTLQVLDEILGGKVQLGGEVRTATVMFSDIRGFTALSEQLAPGEVVRFLNRYLDIMVDVLVEHGGTIDKFIGDAIMASFGVPLSRDDDALRAVRAAVAMIARLDAWNAERARAGEVGVDIGIGIHTGEVVAGNIGSAKKMEYTIIGDTVNTSSRIEQLNKALGTRLLVSAATYERVRDRVVARVLDPVTVKGKSRPVVVYEVTAMKED